MKQTPINLIVLAVMATGAFLVFAGYSGIAARSMASDCINHGDVNLDGTITAADAQLAFFIVLGLYSPTYEEECAADCNGGGDVTAADAQAIFLVVLGLGDCADPIATPTPPPAPTGYVYIPPGTYMRGSPEDEPCRILFVYCDEVQHQVTLTRGIFMMETEVTRQMWSDLKTAQPTLPSDPSDTSISLTMNHPVQDNTWYEAVLYANLLSLQNGLTPCYYLDDTFETVIDETNYITNDMHCNFDAMGYRLPTEAEWEYACRAGTTGPFWADEPNYSSANCDTHNPDPPLNILDSIAWWAGNSNTGSYWMAHPVSTKLANPWGLYDVHGNVCEWCWDWYGDYPEGPVTNPTGPSNSSERISRGGSWKSTAKHARSARRIYTGPGNTYNTIGFRLVRTVP